MRCHATMKKPARRQHFIARFYLRNFAEPMFSDNLLVFDLRSHHWEKRTPHGVRWFKDLYSMFDMEVIHVEPFLNKASKVSHLKEQNTHKKSQLECLKMRFKNYGYN